MWFGHRETKTEMAMRLMKERAAEAAEAMPEVDAVQSAHALGWVSLAIAATELAAPQMVEQLLGLPPDKDRQGAIRAMGVRELGHGISILSEDRPNGSLATAVWSRVAGDMLDTVSLGKAMHYTKAPGQFMAVAAVVGAIGVADLLCATRLAAEA